MPSLEEVKRLLPKAENKAVLITDWQNSDDLISAIATCHKENLKYAKKIAHLFKGPTELQTAKNVFDFLRYEVPYKVESGEAQKVKTIPRMLSDSVPNKTGTIIGNDCKMYAVFTNTILNTLGIPSQYRFVSYKGSQPTHTYSVIKDSNLVIDAVLSTFDTEKPFKYKKDMSLYKMSGIEEEKASREYLDLSSVDATIGAVKLPFKKTANQVVNTMKTTSLAIPRNAFLGLVLLNVRGFATSLKKLESKGNKFEWWDKLGGDVGKLKEAINKGAKKQRILGFEADQQNAIGFEPVSTTAALASAVPVIIEFSSQLKKAGIDANDVQEAVTAIEQGKKAFKQITGKEVKDVIFKKDSGLSSDKISLQPGDLKTPDVSTAKTISRRSGGEDPTKQPGSKVEIEADAPTDRLDQKVNLKSNSIFQNKTLIIGGALVLGAFLFLSRRK